MRGGGVIKLDFGLLEFVQSESQKVQRLWHAEPYAISMNMYRNADLGHCL